MSRNNDEQDSREMFDFDGRSPVVNNEEQDPLNVNNNDYATMNMLDELQFDGMELNDEEVVERAQEQLLGVGNGDAYMGLQPNDLNNRELPIVEAAIDWIVEPLDNEYKKNLKEAAIKVVNAAASGSKKELDDAKEELKRAREWALNEGSIKLLKKNLKEASDAHKWKEAEKLKDELKKKQKRIRRIATDILRPEKIEQMYYKGDLREGRLSGEKPHMRRRMSSPCVNGIRKGQNKGLCGWTDRDVFSDLSRDELMLILREIKADIKKYDKRFGLTKKNRVAYALRRIQKGAPKNNGTEWTKETYENVVVRCLNSDIIRTAIGYNKNARYFINKYHTDQNKEVYNKIYSKCFIYKLTKIGKYKIKDSDKIERKYTGRPGDAPLLFLTELLINHRNIFDNNVHNTNNIQIGETQRFANIKIQFVRELKGHNKPTEADMQCVFKYTLGGKIKRFENGVVKLLYPSITVKSPVENGVTKRQACGYKLPDLAQCVPNARRMDFKLQMNDVLNPEARIKRYRTPRTKKHQRAVVGEDNEQRARFTNMRIDKLRKLVYRYLNLLTIKQHLREFSFKTGVPTGPKDLKDEAGKNKYKSFILKRSELYGNIVQNIPSISNTEFSDIALMEGENGKLKLIDLLVSMQPLIDKIKQSDLDDYDEALKPRAAANVEARREIQNDVQQGQRAQVGQGRKASEIAEELAEKERQRVRNNRSRGGRKSTTKQRTIHRIRSPLFKN